MIATTHLAVGAASGLAAQSLLSSEADMTEKAIIAFTVGFISHLVLDAIPHREYAVSGFTLWAILSVEIAAVFLLILSPSNQLITSLIIFAGMAGGALPDFAGLAYQYFLRWPLFAAFGQTVHFFHFRRASPSLELGYLTQVIIAAVAIIFVKFKSV